jgi:hypothetical protein
MRFMLIDPSRNAIRSVRDLKDVLSESPDGIEPALQEFFAACTHHPLPAIEADALVCDNSLISCRVRTLFCIQFAALPRAVLCGIRGQNRRGIASLGEAAVLAGQATIFSVHLAYILVISRIIFASVRLMLKVLTMERARLKISNFDQLLGNNTFTHALWACAMEVVLFIYRVPWAQVRI